MNQLYLLLFLLARGAAVPGPVGPAGPIGPVGPAVAEVWRAADAAAGTATAEQPFYVAPADATAAMGTLRATFLAAVTADDTNYATIILRRYPADGSAAVTLLSVTTKTTVGGGTGNLAAHTPANLGVLTGAPILLGEGDMLSLQVTKTGTGVQLPAYVLIVRS